MPTRFHRIRALIIAIFLLLGLGALGYRLYDLQILRHTKLSAEVNRLHERRVLLPARRGMLLDCNGNTLSHTVILHAVTVDPIWFQKEDERRQGLRKPLQSMIPEVAKVLSEGLNLPLAEITEKMKRQSHYVVLARKVSDEMVQGLKLVLQQKKLRGVAFLDDPLRNYPNGRLMCHILGYVDANHRGMDGVEKMMQIDLRGQDGWRQIECDSKGREIVIYRNEDFAPRNGCNVVLTLDQTIQSIAEQELDKAVFVHRPDSAVVIVMRPATGEILALACRPDYDPNSSEKQVETLKNRAVSDLNEPGSTFKVVTVAAGLDHRIVNLDDVIFCENGKFLYGGRYLSDHEPYGNMTVANILVKSSNIGAAKIALMLGNERMYRAMKNFGFGEKAFGIQPTESYPGEIRGVVHPLKQWSKLSITRIAMGHEVGVTPIQLVGAISAIANGGNLMQPQIVKRVVDESGSVVREFYPKVRRRVVDPQAAKMMTAALKQVVSKEGTAAKAAFPGFVVAGKTGTAQKILNGQYTHDSYVSSFCGYFPADEPELCIYVMMDNPRSKDKYGGSVAAPVFREIAQRTASYLDLKPIREMDQVAGGTAMVLPQAGGIR